uniref:Transmembrane protein n=1 Tax=Pyxicephalus adspersus TaxID=30357 RepID=A0AAV3AW49_PYXAD|nr:TPA: hypothetical protein GDO54_007375 [Pyxicephalus adspersus]
MFFIVQTHSRGKHNVICAGTFYGVLCTIVFVHLWWRSIDDECIILYHLKDWSESIPHLSMPGGQTNPSDNTIQSPHKTNDKSSHLAAKNFNTSALFLPGYKYGLVSQEETRFVFIISNVSKI